MDHSVSPLPRVSVIIPTFNRPIMLKQAIESVLQQSYQNIEIIVVDDGSEKGINLPVISQFPAVKYLFQENKGPGTARNEGAKTSRCEYIQFLDDDDTLFPEAIAEKVNFLEQNQQMGVVYSDLLLQNRKGKARRLYEDHLGLLPTGDIYEQIITRNFIPIHAMLWRRNIFEDSGGFINKYGHEDWSCVIRSAEITNFGFIDLPLGIYNLHEKSLTHQFGGMFEGKLAIIYQIVNAARFMQIEPMTRARILMKFAVQEGAYGNSETSKVYSSTALRLDPSNLRFKAIRSILYSCPYLVRLALKLSWYRSIIRRGSLRLI